MQSYSVTVAKMGKVWKPIVDEYYPLMTFANWRIRLSLFGAASVTYLVPIRNYFNNPSFEAHLIVLHSPHHALQGWSFLFMHDCLAFRTQRLIDLN